LKPGSLRRAALPFIALVVLACSLALAACGGGSSSSSTTASTGSGEEETSGGATSGGGAEGVKIGYFNGGTSNSYLVAAKKAAEAKATELGMELTPVESNFEPQLQVQQMEQAEQRKSFDYWIMAANSGEEECGAIKNAISSGIPVYVLITQVCGEMGEGIGAIGFVGTQTPELYGTWFENMLSENEPEEMALITGPAETDITGYAEEELEKATKKYPGFNVVSIENTGYTTGEAFEQTQDILQAHPNIGIIASNYAGMTGGVVQAVKAAGKTGQVKIYDLLGEKVVKKFIENGEVTSTLPGLPATEAVYAVESIAKAAEGEKIEPFSYNPIESLEIKGGPFVTKANVAEFEPEY
jgi:ribose transport system substrate-binding protein